jgi:hypothetical protein
MILSVPIGATLLVILAAPAGAQAAITEHEAPADMAKLDPAIRSALANAPEDAQKQPGGTFNNK